MKKPKRKPLAIDKNIAIQNESQTDLLGLYNLKCFHEFIKSELIRNLISTVLNEFTVITLLY